MSEETRAPEQEQEQEQQEVLTVTAFINELNSYAEHYFDTHKPAKMHEWNSETSDYVFWNACMKGAVAGLVSLSLNQLLVDYDADDDEVIDELPVTREEYDDVIKLYKKSFKKVYDLFYPMLRSSLSFASKK